MTPHIQNTSRNPMATGSAWGRLLTIAFLSFFIGIIALVQNTWAVDLSITFNDGGAGVNAVEVTEFVSGTPYGICSVNCPVSVNLIGTNIKVEAFPGSGWQFDSWNGDINGITNPSTPPYSMTGPANVTANFAKTTYTLTYTVNGGGTVSPASPTNYFYDEGLEITATPALGWEFVNWTGTGAGNLVDANSATTTIDIPMAAHTDLVANFAKTTYTLTYSVNGSGTVSPASPTNYFYDEGLEITATPALGWEFVNWTGTGAGNLVDANSATTTIDIPMAAHTDLVANFAKTTYTLTYSVNGSGTVSPASPTNYFYDEGLEITATPALGWEFVNWTGTGAGNLVDANSATTTIDIPMAAHTDLVANFAKTTYTLTYSVNGSGTVSPASPTNYFYDKGWRSRPPRPWVGSL